MADLAHEYSQLVSRSGWTWKFDKEVLKTGLKYHALNFVTALNVAKVAGGQLKLNATVKVPARKNPFAVLVVFSIGADGGIVISGNCACSRGTDCEHIVAVLQAFTERDSPRLKTDRRLKRNRGQFRLAGLLEPCSEGVALVAIYSKNSIVASDRFNRLSTGEGFDSEWIALLSASWMERLLVRFREHVNPAVDRKDDFKMILRGAEGERILKEFLKWQILYWNAEMNPLLLHSGDPRTASAEWLFDDSGKGYRRIWRTEDPVEAIIATSPPWYVDRKKRLIGPLKTGVPDGIAERWLNDADSPEALNKELLSKKVKFAFPSQPVVHEVDGRNEPVVPELHLIPMELPRSAMRSVWSPVYESQSTARLHFRYGQNLMDESDSEWSVDVHRTRVKRNSVEELRYKAELDRLGLRSFFETLPKFPDADQFRGVRWIGVWDGHSAQSAWMRFMMDEVPRLRAQGWNLIFAEGFEMRFVEPDEWIQALEDHREKHWFEFELGVRCGDEMIDLIPVLIAFFEQGRDIESVLNEADQADEDVPVQLQDGRFLAFPVARLRPILRVLLDLWREGYRRSGEEGIVLHRVAAAELLAEVGDVKVAKSVGANLREMSKRLRNFSGIEAVAPPEGLQATLREYQQEGFRWLQFLARYGLGGILADDMGLGKTLQTIAHLLAEKVAGRLTCPAMIVAPTSLLSNWQEELHRFAPSLNVHVHYGIDRHGSWQALDRADVVVTSYSLVHRDEDRLSKYVFSNLILDEAQNIKNPGTKATLAVCALNAENRLCLSGTPMENNLEELWSLFHFLMPGFLGRIEIFRRSFRFPIERDGDVEVRQLLAKRVGPLMLRRKKTEVAKELPPKTEMIRSVELEGAQRDLYETIRASMLERVQEVIDERGVERSQILILDALLKLRQVCCHPRLLKLPEAQTITSSAKTDLLFEMLEEMIAEGRRVLLFSQFASMLSLIEERATQQGIRFITLTGKTKDRGELVKMFQKGDIPLFLISLKAGGTGLNLTRADTVIHYDPWWNPAIESQATDRAYRIGQSQPVFVYKLITKGTIEERIVALQKAKKELVESLLTEGGDAAKARFTPEDLQQLFQPIG